MRSSHIPGHLLALLFVAISALTLASCEDKVASLAAPYYSDTVQFNTTVRNDRDFMQMRTVSAAKLSVGGISHNMTIYSPLMLIGLQAF